MNSKIVPGKLTFIICVVLSLLHAPVKAEEFLAEARVVAVEPLTELVSTRQLKLSCKKAKPSGDDMSVLLHWDLGTGPCAEHAQEVAIVGYRVSYEWNGHIYTKRMAQAPGSFVAVKVSLSNE